MGHTHDSETVRSCTGKRAERETLETDLCSISSPPRKVCTRLFQDKTDLESSEGGEQPAASSSVFGDASWDEWGAQVETAINNVTSGLSDLHLEVGSLILATSSQGEENENIRAQFASVHEQIEADRQRWKQLDTAQAATHVQQQQFKRLLEEK